MLIRVPYLRHTNIFNYSITQNSPGYQGPPWVSRSGTEEEVSISN